MSDTPCTKPKGKGLAGYVLRIIFSAALVALIFYLVDIDSQELVRAFGSVEWVGLVSMLIPLIIIDRLLMSYKWNLLLRASGIHISLWENFKLYYVSSFIGLVLPATIGVDLVRTYQLSLKKFDAARTFASVIVERLLGFLAIAFISLLVLPVLIWGYGVSWSSVILILVSLAVIFFVTIMIFNRGLVEWGKSMLPKLIGQRLSRIMARLYSALNEFRSQPRVLVIFFVLSIIESGILVAVYVIFADALSIDVSWVAVALIAPLILFVVRIPISFNGVGIIELSAVYFFALVGLAESDALVLGLLLDIGGIIAVLPGGLFLLVRATSKRGNSIAVNDENSGHDSKR